MTNKDEQTGPERADEWSPDPKNPEVKSIHGFMLGRSDDDTQYRLYLNSGLNHYLEFAKEDTLHAKKVNEERTIVWLKPSSRVREIQRQTVPVEFLQGEIQRGFLRGRKAFNLGITAAYPDECPRSGCGHCTASCSSLPGTPESAGFTCNC